MKISRRTICALALAGAYGLAGAQSFPSKPIRLVVAGSAGASTAAVARALGAGLSERLGVPVVVDPKPGANGVVAGSIVTKAAPDGYTLMVTPSDSQVLAPLVTKDIPYVPEKDFTPIAKVAELNVMFAIASKVPASTMKEFVALAKSQPGKLTYGSSGVGGVHHLTVEMLRQREGLNMLHVPYKGGAEVAQALAAGEIDIFAGSPLLLAPLAKGGKVKALAIAKATRTSALPDMPTMQEAGFGNFVSSSWYGVFGPPSMPADVLAKLSNAIVATVNSTEYSQRMAASSVDASPIGHEQFVNYVASEFVHWRNLLESSGIKTVR